MKSGGTALFCEGKVHGIQGLIGLKYMKKSLVNELNEIGEVNLSAISHFLWYNPGEKEVIMAYYEVMRGLNMFKIRLQMVKLAQKQGICESARLYNTTGKTVREWVTRYREGGLRGLANRK
ncbi:MAG: helix-turn-helix domain-containing protein, partial [Candidatus Oleimicrobiaceae bacterium]